MSEGPPLVRLSLTRELPLTWRRRAPRRAPLTRCRPGIGGSKDVQAAWCTVGRPEGLELRATVDAVAVRAAVGTGVCRRRSRRRGPRRGSPAELRSSFASRNRDLRQAWHRGCRCPGPTGVASRPGTHGLRRPSSRWRLRPSSGGGHCISEPVGRLWISIYGFWDDPAVDDERVTFVRAPVRGT